MLLGFGVCVLAVGVGVFVKATPAATPTTTPTTTPAATPATTPAATPAATTHPPSVWTMSPTRSPHPARLVPQPTSACKLGPSFVQCCLRLARQRKTNPMCQAEIRRLVAVERNRKVPMVGSLCSSTGPAAEACCDAKAKAGIADHWCLTIRELCHNNKACCKTRKTHTIKDPTCR